MTSQQFAAISLVLVTSCIVAVGVSFALSKPRSPAETAARFGTLRRKGFFILVPAVLALLAYASLRTPFPHEYDDTDAFVVNVVGHQWYWELTDKDGKPVTKLSEGKIAFLVTSADGDVNHGFGIYDPHRKLWHGKLIAQTQAMPAWVTRLFRVPYVNKLVVALSPGEYVIECTTYCDGEHDKMKDTFTVVRKEGAKS